MLFTGCDQDIHNGFSETDKLREDSTISEDLESKEIPTISLVGEPTDSGKKVIKSGIYAEVDENGKIQVSFGSKVNRNNNSLRSVKALQDVAKITLSIYSPFEAIEVGIELTFNGSYWYAPLPDLPIDEELTFEVDAFDSQNRVVSSGTAKKVFSIDPETNRVTDSSVSIGMTAINQNSAVSISSEPKVFNGDKNITLLFRVLNQELDSLYFEINPETGHENRFSELNGTIDFQLSKTTLEINYQKVENGTSTHQLKIFRNSELIVTKDFEITVDDSNISSGDINSSGDIEFNIVNAPKVGNISDNLMFIWMANGVHIPNIDENGTITLDSSFNEANLSLEVINIGIDANGTTTTEYKLTDRADYSLMGIQSFDREVENVINTSSDYYYDYIIDGDYLYSAGEKNGLVISDISEKNSSRTASKYVSDVLNHRFIEKAGTDFAVIGESNSKTLEIIDISDKSNPTLHWRFDTNESIYGFKVSPDGNTLVTSGREVWNISHKKRPEFLGDFYNGNFYSFDISDTHIFYSYYSSGYKFAIISIDTLEEVYSSSNSYNNGLIDGNYLYLSKDYKIEIHNITDPENPKLVSLLSFDNSSYRNISIAENTLYRFNSENPAIDRVYLADIESNVTTTLPSIPLDNYLHSDFSIVDNTIFTGWEFIDINKTIENSYIDVNNTIYIGGIADKQNLNYKIHNGYGYGKPANSLTLQKIDLATQNVVESFDLREAQLFDENRTFVENNSSVSDSWVLYSDNNATGRCCEEAIHTYLNIFTADLTYSGFVEINGTVEQSEISGDKAYLLVSTNYNTKYLYRVDLQNLTIDEVSERNLGYSSMYDGSLALSDSGFIYFYGEGYIHTINPDHNLSYIDRTPLNDWRVNLESDNNLLFVANPNDNQIKIYSTNETNGSLELLSSTPVSLQRYSQQSLKLYRDEILFVKTQISWDSNPEIAVFDISDPINPIRVDIEIPTSRYFTTFDIDGDYLYTYIGGTIQDIIRIYPKL